MLRPYNDVCFPRHNACTSSSFAKARSGANARGRSALKGRHIPAQGNALGNGPYSSPEP